MSDSYYHSNEQVSSIIDDLTNDLNEYNSKIDELVSLVNTMSESSSWKDNLVKSAYIQTCNDYIKEYQKFANILSGFINYLTRKNGGANDLERAYS
jgi:hypothetical protein